MAVHFQSPMKLPVKSIHLPILAKAYRGGFKAGHGGGNNAFRQLLSRGLFYFCETTGCCTRQALEVTLDVRGKDVTLQLDPRNRQFSSLYFSKYENGYETLVARSIDFFLPDDGTFADLGSNWGYFPLLIASRRNFIGRIHAFEPMPDTFLDLQQVIEQSGIEKWVSPHCLAVGSESGSVKMRKTRHSGLAHISRDGAGIDVQLTTIDSFNWDRLDVMKVDVEGHELAAFQGSEKTLESCQPVIIFENGIDDGKDSLEPVRYLEERAYHCFRPDCDEGTLHFHAFSSSNRDTQPAYLNIVALPESRLDQVRKFVVPD